MIRIRIRIILPRPDLQQSLRICTIHYGNVPIYRNDKALAYAWSMSICLSLSKIYLYMGGKIWRKKFEQLMIYRWEKIDKEHSLDVEIQKDHHTFQKEMSNPDRNRMYICKKHRQGQ